MSDKNNTTTQISAEILIIDDTPENLFLLTEILASEGYSVKQASNAKQALQLITEKIPDLILLDIRMPEMDGLELCRQLKADYATSSIPVIFMSALNEINDKINGFKAGGVDYITKPFQSEEVIARVKCHYQLNSLMIKLQNQAIDLINTKEEITKTEHLFQMLSEKITDVVWLMEMTGKNTFVTPSIENFTGFTVTEFLQQTIDDRLTEESAKKAKQAFAEGLNTFYKNPDEANIYRITLELEYKCKNGNTKWGEVLITPYLIETKKTFGLIGVIRDISEHRKTESELNNKNLILTEINELLKELTFQPANKIDYFIINKLKQKSNAKAVLINTFNKETSELVCTATTLSAKESSKIIQLLGKSIIGFRSPVSTEMLKEMITQQIGIRQSLNEITFDAIPKTIGSIIQKMLGIT